MITGAASRAASKPFKTSHDEQIKLVSSFEWIDFDSLKGIEEEFREVVKGSPFVDKTRCDAICMAVKRRCEMLYEAAEERSKKRKP